MIERSVFSLSSLRRVLAAIALLPFFLVVGPAALGWDDPGQGLPLLEQRETADYRGNGAIWSVARAPNGELLLGADQLIATDGARWRRIAPISAHGFRAVAAGSDGRVWIGAIGELGFLTLEDTGDFKFTSLRPQLDAAGARQPSEIWHVQPTDDGIVYVAEQEVYRWNGTRFEIWTLPAAPRLQPLSPGGNETWLYQRGVGLLRVKREGPEVATPEADLPAAPVVWLLGSDVGEPLGEGALLGTSEAVFVRRDGKWAKLERVSAAIAGALPVCAVRLDQSHFAIGTFLQGITIASADDGVLLRLRREHGLLDDQVHTLWRDSSDRLWAGLASGWARITNPRAGSRFDASTGLASAPAHRVMQINAQTFVSSARGVYELAPRASFAEPAQLTPLPSLEATLWDATLLGDALFVAGLGGIWQRSADAVAAASSWRQERFVSADVFCLESSRRPQWLYFVEGTAIKALEKTPAGWVTRDLSQNLGDTAVSLLETADGDLWASTVLKGILRLRLATEPGQAPALRRVAHFRPGDGLPTETLRLQLATVGGVVFAFAGDGVLALRAPSRAFSPEPALRDFLVTAATRETSGGMAYWVVERRDSPGGAARAVVRAHSDANGILRLEPLVTPGLARLGRVVTLSATAENGRDLVWLSDAHTLLRIPAPALAPSPLPAQLRQVRVNNNTSLSLTPANIAPLEASTTQLRFDFSASDVSAVSDDTILYQTRLEGVEDDWSPPQRDSWREFAGLAAGTYRFHVRTIDALGRTGSAASRAFAIALPWHLRWPALVVYGSLAALAVMAAVELRLRRLRRQTQRLNHLVDERTRELRLANAAKADFLASISHEIRNPLNGMVGLVSMLKEAQLHGRERSLAESLGACARSLMRVFDEVLNFSKLEQGHVPVQARAFQLGALLEDVVGVFRATAAQRGAAIALKLPENHPLGFHGDDEKIRTIISNFVGNALKYAPGSPVEVSVDCEPSGESDDVTINVTDHGRGVPPEEQELIFRKFVRGSQAHGQREPGAGLGLATCKVLAGLLGGFVGIESEPSRGATFYLRLRLARATAISADGDKPTPKPFGREQRALIIEDQDYNQIVVQRIAERLGFRPVIAREAHEALEAFACAPTAVVLVDWELPGLKGNDVARQLRALPGGEAALIIATTAHDSEHIRRACFAAGMDGFALKPFDEETLSRLILEADARRTARIQGGTLNLGVFRYISYNDPAKTIQAADDYIATLERELAALERSFDNGDREALETTAHRLRSHASLVAARSLNDATRSLQLGAKTAPREDLEALLHEIRRHSAEAKAQIARWRDQESV